MPHSLAVSEWHPEDGLVLELDVVLLAGMAVLVGALLQGTVGFGLGLAAAPAVSLLDPTLMPGSLLIVGVVLPGLTFAVEHRHVDRRVGWALAGRLLGTAPAVALIVVLSREDLVVVIGIIILAACALSIRTVTWPLNRWTLTGAGFLSAIGGSIATVGGPPMGLVYQRSQPGVVRSTVSLVLTLGSVMALTGLLLTGEMTGREAVAGVAYLPFVAVGWWLALRLRRTLVGPRFRQAVLLVIMASAITVLVRALL